MYVNIVILTKENISFTLSCNWTITKGINSNRYVAILIKGDLTTGGNKNGMNQSQVCA